MQNSTCKSQQKNTTQVQYLVLTFGIIDTGRLQLVGEEDKII
jgi:hypothetical protein